MNLRRSLLPITLAVMLFTVGLALFTTTYSADAHPLGNFTVNRYTRIEVYADAVRLYYVLDMAEIPTFQEFGDIDTDGDGEINPSENQVYASGEAEDLLTSAQLTIDGSPVRPSVRTTNLTFPEGQGGLDTLRLTFTADVPASPGAKSIEFHDDNYGDRLGWREIVVLPASGARIKGSTPLDDISQELTQYPGDLLTRPLDVSTVSFVADTSRAAAAPALSNAAPEPSVARSNNRFTSLINVEGHGLFVILGALALAVAFGALHALEPGHGKTIVGAYFVGEKASVSQAALLGLTIAGTHTLGVLIIGLIAIYASSIILPEQLYPWLALASGVMVLGLGLRLLLSRLPLASVAHRFHLPHTHSHDHHAPSAGTSSPWRTLFWLGLADGLTPSPSALVVLLAAVAIGRIELGLALIVAFSAGLAAVLTAISIGLIGLRGLLDRLRAAGTNAGLYRPWMGHAGVAFPVFAGAAVLLIGLALTLDALSRHPSL